MILLENQWYLRSDASDCLYEHIFTTNRWLYTTKKPWGVSNPLDYRSGHYRRYGLNIQDRCNLSIRFGYVAVAETGTINDAHILPVRPSPKVDFWITGWVILL